MFFYEIIQIRLALPPVGRAFLIAETSPGIVAGTGIAHLADEDVQVTVVR